MTTTRPPSAATAQPGKRPALWLARRVRSLSADLHGALTQTLEEPTTKRMLIAAFICAGYMTLAAKLLATLIQLLIG